MEALDLYGKNWKKVQAHVGSRTTTQVRSHAQKYFAKLNRKNLKAEPGSSIESICASKPGSENTGALQTQAFTPADSPLGGPSPIASASPKCAISPAKEKSPYRSPAKARKGKTVSKRPMPAAIDTRQIEPELKAYPTIPYEGRFPVSSYTSMLPPPMYDPCPYFCKSEPLFGHEFNPSTEVTGFHEGNSEAEVWDLDRFSLDYVPIKPLDLQAVEQPTQQATFNENVRTDFSGIFS